MQLEKNIRTLESILTFYKYIYTGELRKIFYVELKCVLFPLSRITIWKKKRDLYVLWISIYIDKNISKQNIDLVSNFEKKGNEKKNYFQRWSKGRFLFSEWIFNARFKGFYRVDRGPRMLPTLPALSRVRYLPDRQWVGIDQRNDSNSTRVASCRYECQSRFREILLSPPFMRVTAWKHACIEITCLLAVSAPLLNRQIVDFQVNERWNSIYDSYLPQLRQRKLVERKYTSFVSFISREGGRRRKGKELKLV